MYFISSQLMPEERYEAVSINRYIHAIDIVCMLCSSLGAMYPVATMQPGAYQHPAITEPIVEGLRNKVV